MTKPVYRPLFDPGAQDQRANVARAGRRGDELPRGGYVYDHEGRIALAINVALATGRPLLLRGKPGTGKSSLARDVASRLGWRYYATTITSRMRATDLLWSYDTVRRLNDATTPGALHDPVAYITPGVLWWAFSPSSAARRGLTEKERQRRKLSLLVDPAVADAPTPGPSTGATVTRGRPARAVVLIDEIDKADPDLPNDLLTPLGSLSFDVVDVEDRPGVTADAPPLVIITTNEERDLPKAFLRRCVVLVLDEPSGDRLQEIARAHFGRRVTKGQLDTVLKAYDGVRDTRDRDEHEPGLAEFLDAVATVIELGDHLEQTPRWEQVVDIALRKPAGESTDDV